MVFKKRNKIERWEKPPALSKWRPLIIEKIHKAENFVIRVTKMSFLPTTFFLNNLTTANHATLPASPLSEFLILPLFEIYLLSAAAANWNYYTTSTKIGMMVHNLHISV